LTVGSLFDRWELAAVAIVSMYCVVLGVLFRLGRLRGGVRRLYFNRELPSFYRNMAFAFGPTGLAFLLIIAGTSLARRAQPGEDRMLAFVLGVLGLIAGVVACWWIVRPPGWAKPSWVREYDRTEAVGE
jgi:hypothetical protein